MNEMKALLKMPFFSFFQNEMSSEHNVEVEKDAGATKSSKTNKRTAK